MSENLGAEFNEKVAVFSQILAKFNRVHSLTNYRDIADQVADSVAPLEIFPQILSARTAIDVGSGAGFPAIFLSMKMSECEWHLFEPNAKKSAFLSYVKAELNLQNIRVHSQKIELAPKFSADLITSRALMKAQGLIKICSGFYDESTLFLLYKGSGAQDELAGLEAQIYNQKNRNYAMIKGKDVS